MELEQVEQTMVMRAPGHREYSGFHLPADDGVPSVEKERNSTVVIVGGQPEKSRDP